MEYHKGRNIDRLKVADINKYIPLSCKRKENLGIAAEHAHQCHQVLLRAGERAESGNTTAASPAPKSTRACPKC